MLEGTFSEKLISRLHDAGPPLPEKQKKILFTTLKFEIKTANRLIVIVQSLS